MPNRPRIMSTEYDPSEFVSFEATAEGAALNPNGFGLFEKKKGFRHISSSNAQVLPEENVEEVQLQADEHPTRCCCMS